MRRLRPHTNRRQLAAVAGFWVLTVLVGWIVVAAAAPMALAGTPLHERGAVVVGGEPKYLVADASGATLYVSDFAGGAVAVVDMATGLVQRRLPVPDGPVGLALSADGSTLYVASYFGRAVYRFDTASGRREALAQGIGEPWDVLLVDAPGRGRLLAVTEHESNAVAFLDPESLARVASVPTAYYPYQMDVDPAAGRLYVISYGGVNGGQLEAIDLATLSRAWLRGTDTGKGSFDVRLDAANGALLVSDFVGKTLSRVGLDGALLNTRPLGGEPKALRLSSDGADLFAALQSVDQVAAYDPTTGVGHAAEPVGSRPGALTWVPAAGGGATLAVANQGDGTVSLLSAGDPVPEFADVPLSHRFHREIRVLAVRGALGGYQEGGGSVFRPDGTLMRAQLAKVLVAALGLHTEAVEPAFVPFIDVPADSGTYPFDYVQEAARQGIVSGVTVDPPRFDPYEAVTRIQLARMAVRAAAAVGSPLPVPQGASPFWDINSGDPDLPTIMAAYQAGIVSGIPGADGHLRFQPYSPATRGQTARIVFNLLGALHRPAAGGAE
jgi:DNA-binding beta-propeller fold protein YncE